MVIGKSVMNAGAAMMSKAQARSAASPILKTGKGDPKIVKTLTEGLTIWKASLKMFKKMKDALERSSPALKQQLIVLRKSLMLVLRPIGDIMAKFVRPMAVWMMKFAVKWYQLFGTGAGENKSKAAQEDLLEGLKSELVTAEAAGDIQRSGEIRGEISGIETKGKSPLSVLNAAWNNTIQIWINDLIGIQGLQEGIKSMNESLWGDLIPGLFKSLGSDVSNMFKSIGETVSEMWKTIEPFATPVLETVKLLAGFVAAGALFALKGALIGITLSFKGITTVIKLSKVAVIALQDKMSILKTWVNDKFISIWDTLKEKMSAAFDKIKSFIDKIKNINLKDITSALNPFDSKAVGGSIRETGLFQLHAGERVIPAGQATQLENQTSSATINNQFIIQATINNDIDIRDLAEKLSSLQEVELRRRTSIF